jgi:hypothetical protein
MGWKIPKLSGKAQTWSMDLIIAMVIFVLIITIFYSLLSSPQNLKPQQLQEEGQKIASKLESSPTTCDILDHGDIDRDQLQKCFASNPEVFRQQAGLTSHFCIYIQDQNGRTIAIPDSTDVTKSRLGFGDSEMKVAQKNCSELFP